MNAKKSITFFSLINLLGFIGMVMVNGLANALPLNNKTTGELSDQYPNLFVPTGLTFSIWGVIYLLLAVFIVYQIIFTFQKNKQQDSFLEKIGMLFFISSVANAAWIFAWHYEFIFLSFLIIITLLAALIGIYVRLDIGKSTASNKEKYLVHLPFSVYLGWISIATIANITALLVHIGWNRFGLSEEFWTVVVLIVGIALALKILFDRKDIFYALVVNWAFLGILIKRLVSDTTMIVSIVTVLLLGMGLLTFGIIFQLIRRKVY